MLGPGCADPFSPKAVRASMGSVFAQPPLRAGLEATPAPRAALVAHGGEGLEALAGAATVCLGAEREGLPAEVLAACEVAGDDPAAAGGAESLNVAAAAAIALQRISSPAMRGGAAAMLERIEEIRDRGRRPRSRPPPAPPSWRSCGSATWAAKPS